MYWLLLLLIFGISYSMDSDFTNFGDLFWHDLIESKKLDALEKNNDKPVVKATLGKIVTKKQYICPWCGKKFIYSNCGNFRKHMYNTDMHKKNRRVLGKNRVDVAYLAVIKNAKKVDNL